MNLNMNMLLGARKAWATFRENHPRFPAFIHAVKDKGVVEGTEITIIVSSPDGDVKKAGICVRESDLEMLRLLRSLME